VYDDIRWFFLREASCVCGKFHPSSSLDIELALRLFLATHSGYDKTQLPANLLSILERLTTFPTSSSQLNKWWVSELGREPSQPKQRASAEREKSESSAEDEDTEDDWRKFFEDDRERELDSKAPTSRLHKMTVHQSLHALTSHRAVFTRAWLSLLPQLSNVDDPSKTLTIRALDIMHRGVIPHLTRPILLMDWVGSCVDHGEFDAFKFICIMQL
jgi:U3 small nucleolar RNA-associated protein 19